MDQKNERLNPIVEEKCIDSSNSASQSVVLRATYKIEPGSPISKKLTLEPFTESDLAESDHDAIKSGKKFCQCFHKKQKPKKFAQER